MQVHHEDSARLSDGTTEDDVLRALHRLPDLVPGALGSVRVRPTPQAAELTERATAIVELTCDLSGFLDPHQEEVERSRVAVVQALRARSLENQGESPLASNPLELHLGGLKSCQIGSLVVVLLPELTSMGHCWQVLDSLQGLTLRATEASSWIVDCSPLREPEPLILSSLLGLQREFAAQSVSLKLVWLRESAVAPELRPRFESAFSLMAAAGHFFSR